MHRKQWIDPPPAHVGGRPARMAGQSGEPAKRRAPDQDPVDATPPARRGSITNLPMWNPSFALCLDLGWGEVVTLDQIG
jgi:hypothetical protein